MVTISAADPLNLVGIIVPGERIPPASLKNIVLRDGVPIERESPHGFHAGETKPPLFDKLPVAQPSRHLA